jgi:phage FluMu protein Com
MTSMREEILMKPAEATGDAFLGSLIDNEHQVHYQCAPPEPEPVAADDLLRCMCGALLARWVAAGLELKCRRCKRTTLIPYPQRTAVTRRHPT